MHLCRHALVTGCTPSQGRVRPTVWERGLPTADMQYHASSSAWQNGAFVMWFWINPNGKSFLYTSKVENLTYCAFHAIEVKRIKIEAVHME